MIKTFCSGDSVYYGRDDFDSAISGFLNAHPDAHLTYIPGQIGNSWGDTRFVIPVLWAIFQWEDDE